MWKFSQPTLDRQSHLRDCTKHFKRWRNQEESFLLLVNEKYQVLLQPDGVHAVNAKHFIEADVIKHWVYLGHTKFNKPWFATQVNSWDYELQSHQQWMDLRVALANIAEPYASAIAYAKAMIYWHRHHQFCGKCGSKTAFHKAGHERYCEPCEFTFYPRTDPAIIVGVEYQENLLLARQATWPINRYSVIAGFVEPGESFEQAVAREVLEEVNLKVEKTQYIGSQPWPFPCSVMIGFSAQASSQSIELLDGELEKAIWVSPNEFSKKVSSGELKLSTRESISFHIIDRWAKRHNINIEKLFDAQR